MRGRREYILLALASVGSLALGGVSADGPNATTTVTVNWSTANGTAIAGQDYIAASGTLTFSPGETQKTVTVTIVGDTTPEPDETFRVVLSNPTNATLADGEGLGTIEDDDGWAGLAGFNALTPCRLIDTRVASKGPAIAAGSERLVTVATNCGIPATAAAAAFNLTVVGATAPGYLTLYPAGGARPTTSTINFGAGQTRANNAIVRLGTSGQVAVFAGLAAGSTHVILDVVGFFD